MAASTRHTLSDIVGIWHGTNGFRMMPGEVFDEGPASAEIREVAGGAALVVDYTWQHPQEGEQHGVLVVGTASQSALSMHLLDTFHQSEIPERFEGGQTGPARAEWFHDYGEWRWWVRVSMEDDRLVITMDNTVPESYGTALKPAGPYCVMRMVLSRD
ncbi:hypothetical protein ACQP1U_12505 [Actinomycetota bacterium]|nr:hypothetical protein [Micrococcales bacterium]